MKYEGKTLEEALTKALNDLKLGEKDIIYKKEETKGGLFKSATISLTVTKLNEVIDFVKEYLENLLKNLDMEIKFESKIREGQITIKMFSSNNSLLIGKGGKNLEALQNIIKQACFVKFSAYPFIILDVENYKDKQVAIIERMAKDAARKVLQTKKEIKLNNMNSYERRVAHNALSNFKNITSQSEGEEPNRHLVIGYKED